MYSQTTKIDIRGIIDDIIESTIKLTKISVLKKRILRLPFVWDISNSWKVTGMGRSQAEDKIWLRYTWTAPQRARGSINTGKCNVCDPFN